MTIHFGLTFDDQVFPQPLATGGGVQFFGPNRLLQFFEIHLGLTGHPSDTDYLRVEEYRQVLLTYLKDHPNAFFEASFHADQFATAMTLLNRRDELWSAGWDFSKQPSAPPRLKALSDIEQKLRENSSLTPGFADRYQTVLDKLKHREIPVQKIILNEPLEMLPALFRRLVALLQNKGITISTKKAPVTTGRGDLSVLKNRLGKAQKEKVLPRGDGSLMILKAKRESTLSSYLAKLFRLNPKFQPLCLVPGKSRALDNALIQEGLPSMGILSASLARPTLQVIKLIPVFLWEPIDPYKILEFVSLAVKPLEEELANRIAAQMAARPGLKSESWNFMIRRYFEELEEKAQQDTTIKTGKIRQEYQFWFERQRYHIAGKAPKGEIIEIFGYLADWAFRIFEESGSRNNSLLVLSEQAKRIRELLEALPESELSHLELERIVRTIYEPAPVQFTAAEKGHLPYVHHPGSVAGPAEDLLWWNFTQNEPDHFFARWYHPEQQYLEQLGIQLQYPQQENALMLWQRKRPFQWVQKRLILVIPETYEGSEVHPHPLLGDLEACFSDLTPLSYDLDSGEGKAFFAQFFKLPAEKQLVNQRLGKPQPFIRLGENRQLEEREDETISSLETLFYYPYQWVFRHKIRLKKSSILSVVKDNTLMGNLAHRLFERLFREEDIADWDKYTVEQWIEKQSRSLLSREGAVLLMYGREPDRMDFINKVKYAAWCLVDLMQRNGWKVLATEKPLEGSFLGLPINGRADLVLERDGTYAVVDLKWRGSAWREQMIRNEEDLQLVLYAHLLHESDQPAHTAYFIIENGKMIARNNQAFTDLVAVSPDSDHKTVNQRIIEKMEATYRWRMDQIRQGLIEIRCDQTRHELEEAYGSELLDLLEMKEGDAPFDDYRTLISR